MLSAVEPPDLQSTPTFPAGSWAALRAPSHLPCVRACVRAPAGWALGPLLPSAGSRALCRAPAGAWSPARQDGGGDGGCAAVGSSGGYLLLCPAAPGLRVRTGVQGRCLVIP